MAGFDGQGFDGQGFDDSGFDESGFEGSGFEGGAWEDRLDAWETELELTARVEGSDWVTLERAAADTGASRAALRNWYRTGQIPSRLVEGPHGPQRLVPLALVAARAEASPRLRRTAQRRLDAEAQLELLRHRVDQLELRLAALERARHSEPPDARNDH